MRGALILDLFAFEFSRAVPASILLCGAHNGDICFGAMSSAGLKSFYDARRLGVGGCHHKANDPSSIHLLPGGYGLAGEKSAPSGWRGFREQAFLYLHYCSVSTGGGGGGGVFSIVFSSCNMSERRDARISRYHVASAKCIFQSSGRR